MSVRPTMTVSSGQGVARRIRELQRRLDTKKEALVGLPADAGTHPNAGMSYARLGAIHEFGAGVPERSFLRVPLRAAQDQIAADFKRLLKLVVEGELTMTQALEQIGAKGASISQEAISRGISPPNASSTAKRKGSSKPLVDDGHLRQAITYVVRDKDT